MYNKLVVVFISLLSLAACNDADKNELSTTDSVKIIQQDTIIDIFAPKVDKAENFGDDFSLVDSDFSFDNVVFDLGESSDFEECRFNFECDCCSGKLILSKDSTYYYIDYCMADLTVTRGSFSINKNNIIFSSDGIQIKKEYDPSKEYNPNEDIFTLTDTKTEPYELIFKLRSCDQKPLLVDKEKNAIWIATLIDIKVDQELENLEKDGILELFRQYSFTKNGR